jgi:glycine C-acetyltransferase
VSRRAFLQFLETETANLRQAGLLRKEIERTEPQGPTVKIGGASLVNFASSDYFGLAGHPEVKRAIVEAVEALGAGFASTRAAVGTSTIHRELERALELLGTEDALVCASGHHAATGLFEALLGDRDYVFCDEMARPSLADGIRLSRARAYAYRNGDLEHLEDRLKRSRAARFRVIVTDGVFPLTGRIADLAAIYALAERYHAIVVVDDSEGIGVLGTRKEGSHAAAGVADKIDLVTGSFGRALGGGCGGFIAGRRTIVEWLRQKSRTHLASTALSPADAAAALKCLELFRTEPGLGLALSDRKRAFREAMTKDAGLMLDATHPAMSVLVRNAILAQRLNDFLARRGFFAIGYCHPVVPEGQARICFRVTVRHETKTLEDAARAIGEGMKELKIPL